MRLVSTALCMQVLSEADRHACRTRAHEEGAQTLPLAGSARGFSDCMLRACCAHAFDAENLRAGSQLGDER
eukprot:scaffold10248_cov65-Phaeocystis_antarctica.AAC.14